MSPELDQAKQLLNRVIRGDLAIGIMTSQEADQMLELFQTAGENGEPEAWFDLGSMYLAGWMYGPQPIEAIAAFKKAVDGGWGSEAQYHWIRTAYFHDHNSISPEDVRSTLKALDSDENPDGLVLHGYCFIRGFGVEEDPSKSVPYFERAAALGNADAMFELYVLHSTGLGVEVNNERALEWCKKAADAGSARAMNNLGGMYATGNGVEANEATSVGWYEKAAEAGHARAAATLAYMFHTGAGAQKSDAEAARFYELAYDLGIDPGEFFLQLGIDPLD